MKACTQPSWLWAIITICVVMCCGAVLWLGLWTVQSHIVLFCAAIYAHCTTINPGCCGCAQRGLDLVETATMDQFNCKSIIVLHKAAPAHLAASPQQLLSPNKTAPTQHAHQADFCASL